MHILNFILRYMVYYIPLDLQFWESITAIKMKYVYSTEYFFVSRINERWWL